MITKLLTILLEWLYSFGEGIMNLANKLLLALSKPGGGATPAEAYAAKVLTYNPLFYWKFDEASGTSAIDYGSVGANITYSASDIAGQTTGPFGGAAARMVGADSDYINIGTGGAVESNWPANELSIVGWIRGYDGAWSDTTQNFFLSINSATEFIWLQNTATANALNYRYQAGGTAKQQTAVLSPVPSTNWHMFSLTVSLSNDRVRLYYNNTLTLNTTALPTWTGAAWTLARFGSNGAAYGNFDYSHWLVVNSELDGTAITDLYNGGPI